MAGLDLETLCSDEQSVVGAAGTYKSERSIDMWNGQTSAPTDSLGNTVPSDPGKSDIRVLAQMTTGLDSAGGACTIQAQLVMADDENLATNLVVLEETAAIAEAVAIAGYKFRLGRTLPHGVTKRFVGFRFLTAGEAATVGKVTAAIGTGIPQASWYE